jgi:hypothetical protein
MAGTAPTDFQFTKPRDAGPVHCSVWLATQPLGHLRVNLSVRAVAVAWGQQRLSPDPSPQTISNRHWIPWA